MAVTQNLRGTSFPRFTVGKNGPTILQGANTPDAGAGINGDMYLQFGASSSVWQKQGGNWIKIGGDSTRIINGTTQASATPNSLDFTVLSHKVFDIKKDTSAIQSEKLTLTAKDSLLELNTTSTSGDAVDILLKLQGEGFLTVESEAPFSLMTNTNGEEITIRPGTVFDTSANDLILEGGSTTFSTGAGGSVVLKPGVGVLENGYVLIDAADYVPELDNSVVTKKYANVNTVLVNSTTGTVNVPLGTNMVVNNVSTSSVIFSLSASVIDGTVVTIKDGSGTADTYPITITAASSTIDGQASLIVNEEHASVSLLKTSIGWFII